MDGFISDSPSDYLLADNVSHVVLSIDEATPSPSSDMMVREEQLSSPSPSSTSYASSTPSDSSTSSVSEASQQDEMMVNEEEEDIEEEEDAEKQEAIQQQHQEEMEEEEEELEEEEENLEDLGGEEEEVTEEEQQEKESPHEDSGVGGGGGALGDTEQTTQLRLVRKEDVVVHPLKAFTHYADLSVSEYSEEPRRPAPLDPVTAPSHLSLDSVPLPRDAGLVPPRLSPPRQTSVSSIPSTQSCSQQLQAASKKPSKYSSTLHVSLSTQKEVYEHTTDKAAVLRRQSNQGTTTIEHTQEKSMVKESLPAQTPQSSTHLTPVKTRQESWSAPSSVRNSQVMEDRDESDEDESVSVTTGRLSLSLSASSINVKSEIIQTEQIASSGHSQDKNKEPSSEEDEDDREAQISPRHKEMTTWEDDGEPPEPEEEGEEQPQGDTGKETMLPPVAEPGMAQTRSGPVTYQKASVIVGKAIAKAMARESSVRESHSRSATPEVPEAPLATPEPPEEEEEEMEALVGGTDSSDEDDDHRTLDTIPEEEEISEMTESGRLISRTASKNVVVPLSSPNVVQLSHVTCFLNDVTTCGDPQATGWVTHQSCASLPTREPDGGHSTHSFDNTPPHTYYNQAQVTDGRVSLSNYDYETMSELKRESDNLPGIKEAKITTDALPVTQKVKDSSTGNSKVPKTVSEEVPKDNDDNDEKSSSTSSTLTQITEHKLDDFTDCAGGVEGTASKGEVSEPKVAPTSPAPASPSPASPSPVQPQTSAAPLPPSPVPTKTPSPVPTKTPSPVPPKIPSPVPETVPAPPSPETTTNAGESKIKTFRRRRPLEPKEEEEDNTKVTRPVSPQPTFVRWRRRGKKISDDSSGVTTSQTTTPATATTSTASITTTTNTTTAAATTTITTTAAATATTTTRANNITATAATTTSTRTTTTTTSTAARTTANTTTKATTTTTTAAATTTNTTKITPSTSTRATSTTAAPSTTTTTTSTTSGKSPTTVRQRGKNSMTESSGDSESEDGGVRLGDHPMIPQLLVQIEDLKARPNKKDPDYQEMRQLKNQIQMMRRELEARMEDEDEEAEEEEEEGRTDSPDTPTGEVEDGGGPTLLLLDADGGVSGLEQPQEENEQLQFDRTVRRLLAEGRAGSYEKAELAAQLLTFSFDETDSLQAAEECSSIYTAIQFLQQECELCAEKYPMRQMVSMLQCTHRCCCDCAKTYFTFQIKTKNIREVRCPFCNEPDLDANEEIANEYLNNMDILLKSFLDGETHELFQRKLRDWTLMKDPNFRWCNKCSSGFIANPRARKLICPDCKNVTCAQCHTSWEAAHEGISCEAFARWKANNDAEVAAQGVAKHLAECGITCPKCKFTYSLAKGGCMHFTCTQCKFEFCSGCGQPFRQGKKCTVGPYCERLGLHAHHPRNCLFYLRDKEPQQLQNLLKEAGVSFDTEPQGGSEHQGSGTRALCQVQEQKELPDGLKDDICGRVVPNGYAGLCRLHYTEYLVEKINTHRLDPVGIFDEADLRVCLRRNGKTVPIRRWESEKLYKDKLIKLIKEHLPLEALE
ncbi:hypothetical protein Pmani_005643 [Petrolisthes manimaculis]|uniref:RBR-type E3 ubiquitin transferase n=1 Tax=Petrolisthes manimaculis TaxID=1843537 RepID=A0AAE1UHA7_9EUCA|nr:hypothetical protein Pmani_005643 [Petrolisthes manimaculis]